MKIPAAWLPSLAAEAQSPNFELLQARIAEDRRKHEVFPPDEQVFAALEATPFESVRVVIVGQDPYHGAGQAHGLSFSVPPGVKLPPSLKNIFKELCADTGSAMPDDGCLLPWARQGVLLLNSVLTVRGGEAGAHQNIGWEQITDAVLQAVNQRKAPCVFVLWGAFAQKKLEFLDAKRHTVITAPHPSPLSAHRGFFGSRPFSKINAALNSHGLSPVDWTLPIASQQLVMDQLKS